MAAALLALAAVACGPSGAGLDHKVVPIERGEVVVRITAAGPVQPHRAVEVKSRASGQVLSLPFEAGESVSVGTTVAEIDPREELKAVRLAEADLMTADAKLFQARTRLELEEERVELELDRAEANRARARAELVQAEAGWTREQELHGKGLSSHQSHEQARASFHTSRAAVRTAEADLRLAGTKRRQLAVSEQEVVLAEAARIRVQVDLTRARERLADTSIKAALDGIVLERKVEQGQIIASGISNIGGGTTLMVLADVSRISVKAKVDEADIGKLHVGQEASVNSDAYPDREFRGEVVWIAPLGVTESDVTAFEVQVEVLGDGKDFLKAGMTATCQFVAERRDEVLWIPPPALRQYQDEYYVNVVDASAEPRGYRAVAVATGLRNQDRVEILGEGLEAGDEVLLSRPRESETGERGADPIWFLKKKEKQQEREATPPPRLNRSSGSRS